MEATHELQHAGQAGLHRTRTQLPAARVPSMGRGPQDHAGICYPSTQLDGRNRRGLSQIGGIGAAAMSFILRNYQRESLDALYEYWEAGRGNGLVVLPTGSGKSLVIAALCQEILRDYPTMRIGVITHIR